MIVRFRRLVVSNILRLGLVARLTTLRWQVPPNTINLILTATREVTRTVTSLLTCKASMLPLIPRVKVVL